MAKSKKKVKRKPSAITGAGMKVVKEVTEEALKAGKKLKYAGKATKTKKDITILKSLTDPADKAAIKAAKSGANKNAMKKKADSKELKRGIKSSRKEAGREKARIRAKNKEIDAKNAKRSVHEKQQILKSELKAKQNYRASQASKDAEKARNSRQLPEKPKAKVDAPKLKPVTNKNIKKTEVKKPVVKKPAVKKAVKSTKAKKALLGAAAVGAGIALTSKKKNKPVSKESIDNSSRGIVAKKDSDLKSKVSSKKAASSGKASPRNENNKKLKPAIKKSEGKAPSTSSIIDKALGGKKIAPKKRAELTDRARKMIAKKKKDGVPWEKILESITMLLSSHILSKGISKRYK